MIVLQVLFVALCMLLVWQIRQQLAASVSGVEKKMITSGKREGRQGNHQDQPAAQTDSQAVRQYIDELFQ
ncbi:MAG: hypothetical protein R3183_05270 [Oleiphilaceae bacterium]|nr:hypothetical protein [Oleiphilaceae bacterium]